jgi:hypothetical protein
MFFLIYKILSATIEIETELIKRQHYFAKKNVIITHNSQSTTQKNKFF